MKDLMSFVYLIMIMFPTTVRLAFKLVKQLAFDVLYSEELAAVVAVSEDTKRFSKIPHVPPSLPKKKKIGKCS